MTLGEKITALRKDRNYSQEDLADILKVSRQAISKWENDSAIPDIEKIVILARLFHCSVDYLLFNKESEALLEEKKPIKDSFDFSIFNLIKTILFVLFPIISLIIFNQIFIKEHSVSGGMEFIGKSYSFYDLIYLSGINTVSLLTIIVSISLIPVCLLFLFKTKYAKLVAYIFIFIYLVLNIISLIMIYNLKGYDIYPQSLLIVIAPILYFIGFIVSLVVNKLKGV